HDRRARHSKVPLGPDPSRRRGKCRTELIVASARMGHPPLLPPPHLPGCNELLLYYEGSAPARAQTLSERSQAAPAIIRSSHRFALVVDLNAPLSHQLPPITPVIPGPNNAHCSPVKRIICICLIGA